MPLNQTLHISHSDLDGIGPIICDYFLKNNVGKKYIVVNYEDLYQDEVFVLPVVYPEIFSDRWSEIIITDLAIPMDKFVEAMAYPETPIKWFDHHPTSMTFLADKEKYPSIYMDHCDSNLPETKKCGTKLYAEHLFREYRIPAIVKEFVELVNTYDTWQKESDLWPMAEDLNRFMGTQLDYRCRGGAAIEKYYPFIDGLTRKLQTCRDRHFEYSLYEQTKIQGVKDQEQTYLRKAIAEVGEKVYTDSRGFKWAVFSSRAKISFLANQLVNRYGLDYIVGVNTFKGETGKISVRSRDGFDVNDLQSVAGHATAGGGQLTQERLYQVWKQGIELGYK